MKLFKVIAVIAGIVSVAAGGTLLKKIYDNTKPIELEPEDSTEDVPETEK